MATVPKIATTPLELFDEAREQPFLSKIWNPTMFSVIGCIGAIGANWVTRRPALSGIQRIIGLTVLCGVIGKYVDDKRNEYLADRDAVIRDYIRLHPEDFPPFDRKQYKDIFESWIPIR